MNIQNNCKRVVYGLVGFLLLSMSLLTSAAGVSSASHDVYVNSNGDLYLKARDKVVLIASEIIIPIILPPDVADIKITNKGSSYSVQTSTTFNASGWTKTAYTFLVANFDGTGVSDTYLSAPSSSYPSVFLKNPLQSNSTAVGSGVNWGSNVSVTTKYGIVVVKHENADGSAEYLDVNLNSYEDIASGDDLPSIQQNVNYKAATIPGKTSGAVSVGASGNLTYSLPLDLPPGVNGLKPNLTLTYNSRGGSSYLGRGWNVAGLPMVTRCANNTIYGDAYNLGVVDSNSKDKLCLNGQRLQLVSGTYFGAGSTYRTVKESYSKVVYNVDKTLTVYAKSGRIITFDQYVNAGAWYPSLIEDRFGNEVSLSYVYSNTTEQILDTISYASNEVKFNYYIRTGLNPDRYIAGNLKRSSALLQSVELKSEGSTFRSFNINSQYLDYATGLNEFFVAGIQECDSVESNANCKKETRFEWQQGETKFIAQSNEFQREETNADGIWLIGSRTLDWNGDEISDFVTLSANGRIDVHLGNKSGVMTKRQLTTYTIDPNNAYSKNWNSTIGYNKFRIGMTPIDLNFDGKDDLVYALGTFYVDRNHSKYLQTELEWRAIISNGSTGVDVLLSSGELGSSYLDDQVGLQIMYEKTPGFYTNSIWTNMLTNLSIGPVVADTDSNGASEIAFPLHTGDHDKAEWVVYKNETTPGSTSIRLRKNIDLNINAHTYSVGITIDTNGDGRDELLFRGENDWKIYGLDVDVNRGWVQGETDDLAVNQNEKSVFIDYNGDGLKDFIKWDGSNASLWSNKGDGLGYGWNDSGEGYTGIDFVQYEYVMVADYNGDGKEDVIYVNNSNNMTLALSDGFGGFNIPEDGYNLGQPPGSVVPNNTEYPVFNTIIFDSIISFVNNNNPVFQMGDFNGDGSIDFVKPGSSRTTWQLHANTYNRPPAITSITDGFNNQTDIEYKIISDTSVHTPSTGSAFPVEDLSSGLRVVSEIKQSNGVGGESTTSYNYTGAKVHKQGLGFLGFSQVTSYNNTSKQQVITNYSQNTNQWPLLGSVLTQEVKDSGLRQSYTDNSWLYPTVVSGKTYAPYLDSSYTLNYEANGSLTSVSTQDQTFNTANGVISYSKSRVGAGNISGAITQEQYSKTTTLSAFDDDTAEWLLGFPGNKTTVEKVTTSGEINSKTIETDFTRYTDTPSLKVLTETHYPSDAALTYELTYSYDSYGNNDNTIIAGNTNFDSRSSSSSQLDGDHQFFAKQTNALSQNQTNITYDKRFGAVTSLTDIDNLISSASFDTFGRKVEEISTDGTITTITYEMCSSCAPISLNSTLAYKVTTEVSCSTCGGAKGAPTTTVYYDTFGRSVLTETVGFGASKMLYTITEYDANGRVKKVSQPFSGFSAQYWTEYSVYDNFDRPTQIKLPQSSQHVVRPSVSIDYTGSNGSRTVTTTKTVSSPEGSSTAQITVESQNATGLVLTKTEASGSTEQISTQFKYDGFGNIRWSQVDGDSASVLTRVYNNANYLTSIADPDAGTISYGYDALGNLLTQTDNKGQVTKFTYDVLGRQETRTDLFGTSGVSTVNWFYDESASCTHAGKMKGRVCKVEQDNFYETYGYDGGGRLATASTYIHTGSGYSQYNTGYTYNNFSQPKTVTYPNGYAVTSAYDNQGYFYSATDNKGVNVFWAHDVDETGNVTQFTLGNELRTHKVYDQANGLVRSIKTGSYDSGFSETYHQDLVYQWMSNGNLYSRADLAKSTTETFVYDALNRLSEKTTGSVTDYYTYFDNGNINTKPGVSGQYLYAQTDNAGPHAITGYGSQVGIYKYDANGNMINRDGYSITYNTFNKPEVINSASGTATFNYGPDYSRYKQVSGGKTTYYIGGLYEEVVDGATVTKKAYVGDYLQYTDTNGTESYHYQHRDHIGSIDQITDGAGNPEGLMEFEPFGNKSEAGDLVDISRGFTDHEHLDASGLIHMNGRVYDPVIGRFLSADPFVQAPYNSQSYNRYSYVWNNPLNATDPSGYLGRFGHFDMTYAALVFAGFPHERALAVAMAAWAPDVDLRNAMSAGSLYDGFVHNSGAGVKIHLLDSKSPGAAKIFFGAETDQILFNVAQMNDISFSQFEATTDQQNYLHSNGDAQAHINSENMHYSPGIGHAVDSIKGAINNKLGLDNISKNLFRGWVDPDSPSQNSLMYQEYFLDIYSKGVLSCQGSLNCQTPSFSREELRVMTGNLSGLNDAELSNYFAPMTEVITGNSYVKGEDGHGLLGTGL